MSFIKKVSIEKYLFKGCTSLKQILIPSSVTKIDDNAFENCSNLESFVIPYSVTEIKSNIFVGCSSLKRLSILDNLKSVNFEFNSNYEVIYYWSFNLE